MAKEKEKTKKQTKRPTAAKRDLQNVKKRLVNKSFKSRVHTSMRSFEKAIKEQDQKKAQEGIKTVFSLMDKGAKRGLFKPNKAARAKANAVKRLAALAS